MSFIDVNEQDNCQNNHHSVRLRTCPCWCWLM